MYTCINCTLLYLCTVIAQYIYIVIYIFTEYIYIHILYTLSEIVIDYCGAEKHLPCVCVLILSIVLALHLCLRLSRRIHLYVCAYQSTRVPACRRVYTAFSTLCSQLIGLLLASVCAILSRTCSCCCPGSPKRSRTHILSAQIQTLHAVTRIRLHY